MNTLDCVVTTITVPPHQRIDDQFCCWECTVEYECYGIRTKTIQCTTRQAIQKVATVGYTWAE